MIDLTTRRQFLIQSSASLASAVLAPNLLAQAGDSESPIETLLWCWDSRMTWDDEPEKISTKMATSDQPFPYLKRAESFQVGFRRLVDYCSKIGVEGIIVWGFLRDGHGGVEAAKDLCKHARDKGVAILPGVGLCSYGGYYFEGDHPYNLQTYLKQHPERRSRALNEGGDREFFPVLDPSLEANRKWWLEGLEWMLDTFEVGGIDYEMGDFLVNPSPSAVQGRKDLGLSSDENILDSILATQDLFPRAIEIMPEGVFINSTYRGFHQIGDFPAMDYVEVLPEKTVWQYTLRHMVRDKDWVDRFAGVRPHRMYGYLHWFNSSTGTQDQDFVEEIARVYPGLHQLGFEYVGTYGEISAIDNPLADRNYRAQVAWAKNPSLSQKDFR
ncbi:MAG: hypothetical protein KC944_17135 [Candidatus Omnitrophica bacterium]|nr:hypothetical protein [Candidatus Omnitrophota bacterium]